MLHAVPCVQAQPLHRGSAGTKDASEIVSRQPVLLLVSLERVLCHFPREARPHRWHSASHHSHWSGRQAACWVSRPAGAHATASL
eukprot:6188860-Pleurochrysis_carterae.AAC.3